MKTKKFNYTFGVVLILLAGLSFSISGQASHTEPYLLDTGVHDGAAVEENPAFLEVVYIADASSIRLNFKDYNLGTKSYLTLTSIEDGKQQTLDSKCLGAWDSMSDYFIGEAVLLELYVDPRDDGVFAEVDEATVFRSDDLKADFVARAKTICGDHDNRIGSSDPRVGRLLFPDGVCTGWLIPNGLVLAAGHCGDPDGNFSGAIMEFNVPQSTPDGGANAASPENRYAVNTRSVRFESDGTGADWAIFRLQSNAITGLSAHEAQGFFKITTSVPGEDTTMRVTGHGIDPFPTGPGPGRCGEEDEYFCNSDSLTQQTGIGRFDSLSGTTLEHEVDTMPANSGSPVIWESNGYTVGIHTAGGCGDIAVGDENHGTWFGYEPLHDAILSRNPSGTLWVDSSAPTGFLFETGTIFLPFKSVTNAVTLAPSGSTLNIYPGSYSAPVIAGENGKSFTLVPQLGTVVIGE